MKLIAAAPLLLFAILLTSAGCATPAQRAEAEIRERIASIRAGILRREVDGILNQTTPDWIFVGSDGKNYDRTAYRARTTKLFADVVIESVNTDVTQVAVEGARARVNLKQHMVRWEGTGATRRRWEVTYDEVHQWRRTDDGWRMSRVEVSNLRRAELPPGT